MKAEVHFTHIIYKDKGVSASFSLYHLLWYTGRREKLDAMLVFSACVPFVQQRRGLTICRGYEIEMDTPLQRFLLQPPPYRCEKPSGGRVRRWVRQHTVRGLGASIWHLVLI